MRFYPFPLRAQVVFIVFKYIPNHIFIYIGGSAHEGLTRDVPQTKHKTQVSRVPSGRRQHPADGSSTSNSGTACLGHALSSHRDLVWTRKTTHTSTGVYKPEIGTQLCQHGDKLINPHMEQERAVRNPTACQQQANMQEWVFLCTKRGRGAANCVKPLRTGEQIPDKGSS